MFQVILLTQVQRGAPEECGLGEGPQGYLIRLKLTADTHNALAAHKARLTGITGWSDSCVRSLALHCITKFFCMVKAVFWWHDMQVCANMCEEFEKNLHIFRKQTNTSWEVRWFDMYRTGVMFSIQHKHNLFSKAPFVLWPNGKSIQLSKFGRQVCFRWIMAVHWTFINKNPQKMSNILNKE